MAIKAIEPWAIRRPKIRVNGMVRLYNKHQKTMQWVSLRSVQSARKWVGHGAIFNLGDFEADQILESRRSVDYRLPAADDWRCASVVDLPEVAQKALHSYHHGHGCRELHPDTLMWYGNMKIVDLMYGVMNDIARTQGYRHFDHYHQWYLEKVLKTEPNRGVPEHSKEVWPVILSTFADEGLQDGSHRFHQYVEQGRTSVPVLAYTTELQEIEKVIQEWKEGKL